MSNLIRHCITVCVHTSVQQRVYIGAIVNAFGVDLVYISLSIKEVHICI